jgi:hypothetical protein
MVIHYSHNQTTTEQIEFAKKRLREKLLSLDLSSLAISEYNQRYLADIIKRIDSMLGVYGDLLALGLSGCTVPIQNIVFVDYGGGSGVLSFLAKEIGIGIVIYEDIYDVSCNDVLILSQVLALPLDHIVCGDMDELISYINKNSLSVDIISSNDVLEHIYNIDAHFEKMPSLSTCSLVVVYGTSANAKNPLQVYEIKKKQKYFEHTNRNEIYGHKKRDSLLSYFEMRKQIITSYAPDLDSNQVQKLTHATRGLKKNDIEKTVDEYRQNEKIPLILSSSTDTCDPITGNWCEHLIDIEWLKESITRYGFSVSILPGYYTKKNKFPSFLLVPPVNFVISLLGKKGLLLSPYYIVYAKMDRKAKLSELKQ